jgi:hypothetical protein
MVAPSAWIFSLMALSTSVQAFVSKTGFSPRHQRSRSQLLAQETKEEEPLRPSPTRRSIGNVVQGLHGSKYQFGSAGINYEGQQFAEMGYSSGLIEQDNYDDDPMPNWALKLQQSGVPNDNSNCPQLELDSHGMATVQVQNQERSWEKYYSFLVGDEDILSWITVEPRLGMLAPRGGVSDFSDQAQLKLKLTITANENQPLPRNRNCWLLVGTEEESWFYKVLMV